MTHYLEAQYRATCRRPRRSEAPTSSTRTGRFRPAPPRSWPRSRLGVPSVITMHGGDVYVNPEQGYDFPTRWYVRPPLRWTLNHAGALTAITEDCRQHALRAGAPDGLHPARLQRHRSAALQSERERERDRSTLRSADDLRLPPALPPEGHSVPHRGRGPAQAPLPRPQAGARGRRLRAARAGEARGGSRDR